MDALLKMMGVNPEMLEAAQEKINEVLAVINNIEKQNSEILLLLKNKVN
jgi:hypothetical protein